MHVTAVNVNACRRVYVGRSPVALTEPARLEEDLHDCEPSQTHSVINTLNISDV